MRDPCHAAGGSSVFRRAGVFAVPFVGQAILSPAVKPRASGERVKLASGTHLIEALLLKIKRGDNAFYRALRSFGRKLMHGTLPLPKFIFPFLRLLYHLHFGVIFAVRWLLNYFYREPLFRSRCVSVGEGFHMWLMTEITGHPKIVIGNNVSFHGFVGITSGRVFDEPRLVIGDRVEIGHNVSIVVNKEIVIEEGVMIASGCRFMDTDAHPREAAARIAHLPPPEEEIKPVRICRNAWIGQNCFIMKGVTVGEAAIIGASSVVLKDVPPSCVAMGNPARVVGFAGQD
jgi:acetyltransferase-like isoleucine patch superfamily enzyme